jgi:hypothetical protein
VFLLCVWQLLRLLPGQGGFRLSAGFGVGLCLLAGFFIARGPTGLEPTISCTNDELFYIRLSRSLALYGQENHFGDYLASSPERYSGTTPYHYLELWLNAGLSHLTGASPQVCWQAATRPLLLALVLMGLAAWAQRLNLHTWLRLALVVLCTAWGFGGWTTVPFLNEAPSYTAYTDLLLPAHQSAKWLPAILACWLAGFAYRSGDRLLAACWWATLPILHIGLVPWWLGTTLAGIGVLSCRKTHPAVSFQLALAGLLALVWLVCFYGLTQNAQISRIGLADGSFFGPEAVRWTPVAGQFLRVGVQLVVTLGPALVWALGYARGSEPERTLIPAAILGLAGAYVLRCLTSDVLDAWQVLNLGIALTWVGLCYPIWFTGGGTRTGSLFLVGFALVSLAVRLTAPPEPPLRLYDYSLATTTDVWVPLPPVAERTVYDSIPHLLPTGVYRLSAHRLPRFWIQPPLPALPSDGIYRTEITKHLQAYPFAAGSSCTVSRDLGLVRAGAWKVNSLWLK